MSHPSIVAGRTAVVTGAASGIGLAAARYLANRGMTVAMIDLPGDKLQDAATQLGKTAHAIGADVADREAVDAAGLEIASLPPVTLLFNNAGMGMPSSALGSPEAWDRTLAVNFGGVLNVAWAFVPAMLSHGEPAAVLITGSKQGITLPPGNPAYNVSKAAVKAYAESLAHELRNNPQGCVSAHLMIPGWVHTGLTAASGAPKPDGAWTATQAVDFMFERLAAGDFYILCPDNEVTRALDERRIAWAAGDIIENRPALSRWHQDWTDAFNDFARKHR